MSYCVEGYVPNSKLNCKDCQLPDTCKSCCKCQNCKTAWCGKPNQRPNFVVAHSVCPKCIDKELKPDSVCKVAVLVAKNVTTLICTRMRIQVLVPVNADSEKSYSKARIRPKSLDSGSLRINTNISRSLHIT